MSRRETVKLNLEVVNPLIKKMCRSNVVFCELMGRKNQPTWVTDWNRKPKPKNLPSPEEAARMCILLQTTPEEILVEPEDIELVRNLIDAEKKNEELAAHVDDGLDAELVRRLLLLTPEEMAKVDAFVQGLLASR